MKCVIKDLVFAYVNLGTMELDVMFVRLDITVIHLAEVILIFHKWQSILLN